MKIGFLVGQPGAGREQDGSWLGTGRGINDEGWTMKDERKDGTKKEKQ